MPHSAKFTKLAFAAMSFVAIPLHARAQDPAAKPSPDLAGIAHIALRVHDLAASVAFYQNLGFVKAFELSREGAVYEAFIKINDRQFIELYPATDKEPQIGFLHVCFEGRNLQSVHDYYVAQGLAPKDVRTAGAGNLLFTMPGPDTPSGAQNMEYTQYMPGSMHSKDFGQHLGVERIATSLSTVDIAFSDPLAAASFYADKVGFVRSGSAPMGAGSTFRLPGGPDQAIRIAAPTPGLKAHITLAAAPAKAATDLKRRGIPFERAGGRLVLSDPDGNEVDLGADFK